MKVYFISGLAADGRLFKNIRLPEGFELVHLDWLKPARNETLGDYAVRMAERIDRSEPFGLLGLSLGGMLVTEIARRYPVAKTILISSVPSPRHLPFYFHIGGRIWLHRLLPVQLIKSATITKHFFSAETPEDKEILRQTIRESDNYFIRWAMDAIVRWKGEDASFPHIHIHGTRDEILPVRYTTPTHRIPGAGHLMVMNRSEELNRIIGEYLLT